MVNHLNKNQIFNFKPRRAPNEGRYCTVSGEVGQLHNNHIIINVFLVRSSHKNVTQIYQPGVFWAILTTSSLFGNITTMERFKALKSPDENPTLPEIESYKKGWRKVFRIFGLLTLGAIGYITTEVVTGNFDAKEISDGIVILSGLITGNATLQASKSLRYASSIEAKIASSKA